MPVNASIKYSGVRAEPIFNPESVPTIEVQFMPNVAIKRGGLVGQITAASQSEIQTIDYSGTWAEGDWIKLSITGIDGGTFTTPELTFNSTPAIPAATVKAALDSLLEAAGYYGATVTVQNNAPTDQVVTFGGTAANKPMPLMTVTKSSTSGTVQITRTQAGRTKGVWGPYDSGASDGRQTPRGVAAFDFRTDYGGRVVFATQADPSYGTMTGGTASPEHGIYAAAAPVWIGGYWRCADLYRWDSTSSQWVQYPDSSAVSALGRIVCGAYNDPTGILSIR